MKKRSTSTMTMNRAKSTKTGMRGLHTGQATIELTATGMPRGYRDNPLLLAELPARPRRGFALRNPANWIEKECLYCGALMVVGSSRRIFCSINCRTSYKFRQRNPLLAM
jgi:hypothetical protein